MTEPLRNVRTSIEATAADGQTYRFEAEGWASIEGVRARIGAFLAEIEMDQAQPAPTEDRACVKCGRLETVAPGADIVVCGECTLEMLGRRGAVMAEPNWADLYGAAPNYTGGQDVSEWLDEQRGEK